jgi:hypothetical protein
MKDVIHGIEKPYMMHMNWNNDKETKRKFNQQLGDWYVRNNCTSNRECCVANDKPEIVCHFRDKPSKIPCPDSPLIEDPTSFW